MITSTSPTSTLSLHVVAQGVIRVGYREHSRGEIARATGLSMSHVSRIFSGQRTPTYRTAKVIAQYLKVTVDELFTIISDEGLDQGQAPTPASLPIAA